MQKLTWQEATKACPPGFRIPSQKDFIALLGGCDEDSLKGFSSCAKCSSSAGCASMFGADTGSYWSSTSSGGQGYNAWGIELKGGLSDWYGKDLHRGVRCVRGD